MKIDLHTHSTFSDGTDTPTMLVANAQKAGVGVVALCDHDTFDGLSEAMEMGRRIGVRVIPGIEISACSGEDSVHLLGYGTDIHNADLLGELSKCLKSRQERIPQIVSKLTEEGIKISVEDVQEKAAGNSIGRPHVADAMVAAGYVKHRNEAFEKYLAYGKPAYVGRYEIPVEKAIDLVHSAGGAAVLAHPLIKGRGENISTEIIEKLTLENGLDGIEVDHPDQDNVSRDLLRQLGHRLGLMRTGGSDYHGTGKIGHALGSETTRHSALQGLVTRIRSHGGKISVL